MAAPPYTVFKNASITIDGDQFANALTRARLVPEVNKQTLRTLVPDGVIQDSDTAVWTFEITAVQAWAAAGISKALWDARGTQVEVVLQLEVGTGKPTWTFDINVDPTTIGGEQGQILVSEAEFGVIGEPVPGTSA